MRFQFILKTNNNQFFSKFSKRYIKIKVLLFYLRITILFRFSCIISAPTIECAGFVGTNLRYVYAKYMIIHVKIIKKLKIFFFIYVNFMIIYVKKVFYGRTDGHQLFEVFKLQKSS